MAKREILEKKSMAHLLKAVSHLVQLPKTHMWLDYDEEADVLYVHFEDQPRSTHSDIRDNGVILDSALSPGLALPSRVSIRTVGSAVVLIRLGKGITLVRPPLRA